MRNVVVFAAVTVILLGLAASVQAETILYKDTFTNTTGANQLLSNHPLDITSSDYGATAGTGWTSSSYWSDNYITGRAYTSNSTAANANVWLPLTPQAGVVYTLEAKQYMYQGQDSSAATSQYFCMGFGWGSTGIPSTSATFSSVGKDWLVVNPLTSSYKLGYATRTATSWTSSYITYNSSLSLADGWHTYKVVLDTTTALWSTSFYVDDTLFGSASYTSNPIITSVGFGGYVGNGSSPMLDWIQLSAVAVPEPSTLAMLAAGLAGLVAYAWRKRK